MSEQNVGPYSSEPQPPAPGPQGQYPPGQPPYGYGPPLPYQPAPPNAPKSFLGSLFDFNFNNFITPTIVKAVYGLATVLVVLFWLGAVISGFAISALYGMAALIIGAVIALLYLCFIRMTLEFYLSIVRMSQDIHQRLRG